MATSCSAGRGAPGRALLVASMVVLATVAGACGQIKAHELEAFVREGGGISVEAPSLPPGEALIRVANDSRDPARIVLARLEAAVEDIAVAADGIVDVGTAADVTYEGAGYEVVAKIDDLSPHYARARTEGTIHAHLRAGDYVLFSNFPGDFSSGRWATFTVR